MKPSLCTFWLFERGDWQEIQNPLLPGTLEGYSFVTANGYWEESTTLGWSQGRLAVDVFSALNDSEVAAPYPYMVWLPMRDEFIFAADFPSLFQLLNILALPLLTAELYAVAFMMRDQWWKRERKRTKKQAKEFKRREKQRKKQAKALPSAG